MVTVLSGATAIPDGRSAAIGFGTSQQGGSWPTKTLTVRNDGTRPLATFVVDVPRGALDVAVVMGGATAAHEQVGVNLEGMLVGTVTSARNQSSSRSYHVNVADGQLTALLDDLGGADPNVVINALETRQVGARQRHHRAVRRRGDFVTDLHNG